jgi:hypothetical protein
MPSSVAVLRDAENVTVFTVSPEAGADDILQASLSFIRAPTRLALWDLRRSTLNEATTDELRHATRKFLSAALAQKQGGRAAIVIGGEAAFGLMRMLITHAELGGYAVKLRAFRNLAAARNWLLGRDGQDDTP